VYNLGIAGADAYAGTDVITPPGTVIAVSADGSDHHVNLSPGFQFAFASPSQRIFLVDQPIAYLCDPADGRLKRYAGHAFTASQASVDTPAELLAAGATESVASSHLDCANTAFTYHPGTSERGGLVTLRLTLADSGETISLLHQVHVDNVP
jgi:MSHA biogenesis protein MshO